ncbi:unnamed protein product [Sympodiomycopsis kandeliae]
MSNIYITEPPTSGRVLLSTSKGDIEIELWAKECPKACRNFIALALEGYYDGIVWHRIVPGFCVQSGDPTGTGTGGESFYGEPFEDEPHQRLRFNRRGLLAMANPGESNHNESQFFLTLDSTPELQNKHTLFGRISGPTVYNLLSLSEVELSETEPDRPVFPPKLHSVKVLENPFDDIVPRITKAEKKEQEAARRRAKLESGQKREKVKKNTGLLSFGEAEEETTTFKKGSISSHDLLKNDKRLRKEVMPQRAKEQSTSAVDVDAAPEASSSRLADSEEPSSKKRRKKDTNANSDETSSIDLSKVRSDHALGSHGQTTSSRIEELEASIRGLSNQSAADEKQKKKKDRKGKELLEAARQKYQRQSLERGAKDSKREKDTMDLLRKFQMGSDILSSSKSKSTKPNHQSEESEEIEAGMKEYGDSDDEEEEDNNVSWRSHQFHSKSSGKEEQKAEEEYITLDPRDTTSSSAARLGFGAKEDIQRAKEDQLRVSGRRGRDWVDERIDREGERGRRGANDRRPGRDDSRRFERRQDDNRRSDHRRDDRRGDSDRRRDPGRRDDSRRYDDRHDATRSRDIERW